MSLSWWLLLLMAVLLAGCVSPSRPSVTPALLDGEWRSFDGKVMPFQKWGSGQPRAVVIAVHGLSGAASDFWLAGERLAARGIHLYACDLRGQGRDPDIRERGHVRSPRLWRQDLQTFASLLHARHEEAPQFWMGESLGSLIVLHTSAASKREQKPAGLILTSPIAGLRQSLPGGKSWLLEMASLVAPRKRVSLGELAGVDEAQIQVTSTTTHGGQMAQTPHHVSSFTVRLLAATGRWMNEAPETAKRTRLPLLMLASPHDVVSSPAQIESLYKRFATTDKTLRWYERSHHLLLHDVEREQVAADLAGWIEKRINSPR